MAKYYYIKPFANNNICIHAFLLYNRINYIIIINYNIIYYIQSYYNYRYPQSNIRNNTSVKIYKFALIFKHNSHGFMTAAIMTYYIILYAYNIANMYLSLAILKFQLRNFIVKLCRNFSSKYLKMCVMVYY